MSKKMTQERLEEIAAAIASAEAAAGRTLTAEDVVAVASNPDSPLHEFFDWNDGSAAHKYRIEQARHLIYKIKVEITCVGSMVPVSVPMYVRDPDVKQGPGMVAIEAVLDDAARTRAILDRELCRLESFLCRVRDIAVAVGAEGRFTEVVSRWAAPMAAAATA